MTNPTPQERAKEFADSYYEENKNYHDSDGVDVHEVSTNGFLAGYAACEGEKDAEIKRLTEISRQDQAHARAQFEELVKKDALIAQYKNQSEWYLGKMRELEKELILEKDLHKVTVRHSGLLAADLAESSRLLGLLRETGQKLLERIDHNGGIGEYSGGPSFVVEPFRKALSATKGGGDESVK